METPSYQIGEVYPESNEDQDNYLDWCNNGKEFHIGQCYDKQPAKQIMCKKCGGNKFHVAQGSYYTAIRCSHCMWEMCIHDG